MCKRKGLTVLEFCVIVAIIGILLALLIPAVDKVREAAERTQVRQAQRAEEQRQKDAWPFEKYFEDRGNGVYHVEWDDIMEPPFLDPPPPKNPAKVRTTQELATILGEWRKYHPELRIVTIMDVGRSSIIVTEPK